MKKPKTSLGRAANKRRESLRPLRQSLNQPSIFEDRKLWESRLRGFRRIARLRKLAKAEPLLNCILQVSEAMDTHSVYTVVAFLVSRNPDLGNRTALQLLKAGEVEREMAEALTFLKHGA